MFDSAYLSTSYAVNDFIGKVMIASMYLIYIVGALIILWIACWLLVTFCDTIKILAKAIFGDVRAKIRNRKEKQHLCELKESERLLYCQKFSNFTARNTKDAGR